MISIMVCLLKELDTSALSVSPRWLTEGVLEGEGPTSIGAGAVQTSKRVYKVVISL